ncbi:UspA domain protein [Gloeothece citriformis PCC 7424]|uniref:UspA domain protein n=1 Tax=Gloeothece citriformis (strain PCC 7424) TaxID=65393 RepID=B7KAZ0_GLOC7|nr:universal stress protein [Gloeothece citriformis]ACK70100.1 UspA domain protein [Gloeothece citriformis PCC 7424]
MSLFTKNRVLVPIDFSEASFHALEETLAFVEQPVNVYVLHVLTPLSAIEPGVMWDRVNDHSRIDNVKKAFSQRCQGMMDRGIHFDVVMGDPGGEIVSYAQKHNIELIVIPSHGRTGLSRLLLGSVAERVARCSHCPVLILRRHKDK